MTDRILNIKTNPFDNLTNLYVTDDEITYRILCPYFADNFDTAEKIEHTESLLSHTVYDSTGIELKFTPHVWTINDKEYYLAFDGHIKLSDLQPRDWVCGAYVRIFCGEYLFTKYNSNLWGYNLRTESYISKRGDTVTRIIKTKEGQSFSPIKFMPRTRTDTFLTAPMQVLIDAEDQLITNIEFGQKILATDPDNFWDKHTLRLELTGAATIEAGESAELTVTAKYNGEVFDCGETFIVEAVDGYAPHRRVTLEHGVGKFKVQALGLESGEQLRVKINSSFETSLAELVLDVI